MFDIKDREKPSILTPGELLLALADIHFALFSLYLVTTSAK